MAYEYLWFDLGMTLVETSRSIRYQKVLEDFQIVKEEKEIRKAYHITDKIFMREYPHVLGQSPEKFFPWYLGVLNYELNIRISIPEVYEALMEKKTNESQQWKCIQLLDTIVISSEIEIEKPDVKIFEYALSISGADRKLSLYIGDNYYDDAIGSAKAGIDCILVNPYGTLGMEEIKNIEIIPSVAELESVLGGVSV